MSAKRDEATAWEILFKYPGKKAVHWKAVCSFIGTEREAEQHAQQLYIADQTATDFMATPLEERA